MSGRDDRSGFAAAVAAAQEADLCVALVGDLAGLFGRGTSGEGCDAEDLRLPGMQADLLDELLATGTPLVVIVVSGRPYALGDVHGRAAGLVQAFMPGEEGGQAIAGVLSGRVQPSGRLPVQIPRRAGGQPGTYLQPPLGVENAGTSSVDPTPLFPFGHGCSYTTFQVDDLRLSSAAVPTDGEFTASVRVRNTGTRAGEAVIQLYLHDVVASVTRPVKQLAGFVRVPLEAGVDADVSFSVHADRTAFTGRNLQRIVEPGEVEVLVGTSAVDLPCRAVIRLTGPSASSDTIDASSRRSTFARRPRCAHRRIVESEEGPPTLASVAASAGVSVATVSKVLNGRSDVGPATRARVQSLLQQQEYVGRRAEPARQALPESLTVELVFHGRLSPYCLEILQGVLDAGTEAGVAIAVSARSRQDRSAGAQQSAAWVRHLARVGPLGGDRRHRRCTSGRSCCAFAGPPASRRHRPAQRAAQAGDECRDDQLLRRSCRNPAPALPRPPPHRLPGSRCQRFVQPGADARLPRRHGGGSCGGPSRIYPQRNCPP